MSYLSSIYFYHVQKTSSFLFMDFSFKKRIFTDFKKKLRQSSWHKNFALTYLEWNFICDAQGRNCISKVWNFHVIFIYFIFCKSSTKYTFFIITQKKFSDNALRYFHCQDWFLYFVCLLIQSSSNFRLMKENCYKKIRGILKWNESLLIFN